MFLFPITKNNILSYFPIFSSSSKNVLHFPLSILTASTNNTDDGNVPTDSMTMDFNAPGD